MIAIYFTAVITYYFVAGSTGAETTKDPQERQCAVVIGEDLSHLHLFIPDDTSLYLLCTQDRNIKIERI